MATNYPGSLDNFTNPTSASPINSPSHADQHSNANDAIEAIEGELGTNPKGAKSTVKARLDDVDTAIATKAPIASPTFTGTVTIPSGSAITGVPYLDTANTFTGGVQQITTATAATVGLIVKATASQTASLMEWQNSAGNNLAYISTIGSFVTGATVRGTTGGTFGGNTQLSSAGLTVYATAAGNPGAIVRGAASQTANLQEWQDSAGLVQSVIGNTGQIATNQRGTFGSATPSGIAHVTIFTTGADRIGLGIRGAASQTADLQQWQNSAGTVLSKVDSAGSLTIGTSGTFISASNGRGVFTTSGASQIALVVKGAASQTANLQEWQDGAGTILARVNQNGAIVSSSVVIFGAQTAIADTELSVYSTVATQKGIVIKGFASQSANLQEWQDSTGAVLASASASGSISAASFVKTSGTSSQFLKADGSVDSSTYLTTGTASSTYLPLTGGTVSSDLTVTGNFTVNGTTTNLNSTNLVIEDKNIIIADVATPTDTTADGAGITIKGATDKTFNWVQSTGRFTSSEPIQSSAFVSTYVYASQVGSTVIGSATLNTNSDTGGLLINTAGAANKGLTIRGAASQTANLTQWQDSVGNVLTRVQADGTLGWGSAGSALQNSSGRLIVNPSLAAYIAVTVKGAVSQTANLTEWQNSSGTVLGMFNAYGTLTANNRIYAGWAAFGSGFGTSADAGNVVLIAKGSASQTANLQEWQNSSANVSLAITPDGSIKGGNSSTISANTATTIDTVPLSSFTTIEYTISIKQGSKIRSSKVLVHTDGTSIDSTEYGIMEMGGGITGILVTASVSSTNSILQVTITDASTTNATVKIIKTML